MPSLAGWYKKIQDASLSNLIVRYPTQLMIASKLFSKTICLKNTKKIYGKKEVLEVMIWMYITESMGIREEYLLRDWLLRDPRFKVRIKLFNE